MDHFEAASPLLFRKIEMFRILVSERRMRHKEIHNKGKLMGEFHTMGIVLVRKQVNPRRKYGIDQTLVFKPKGPYRILVKDKSISYWIQNLPFCEK